MDRIYGGGRWFDEGYCEGKRAMLSLTTGGGPEPFSEGGITGEINTHFNSINYGIFRFVGFDVLPPFVAWAPARIGEARQKTISSNMSSASSPSPKRNRSPVAP